MKELKDMNQDELLKEFEELEETHEKIENSLIACYEDCSGMGGMGENEIIKELNESLENIASQMYDIENLID